MNGYLLFRKDSETALVLKCEDDDELFYLLRKLERSRVSWLKTFARGLIEDFFAKSQSAELDPPVKQVSSITKQ